MLRLTSVFTSHALFQHSAPLAVKGECDTAVSITIERGGAILSRAEGMPEGGRFAVVIHTPEASFAPCTMTVSAGGESVVLEDILFGELWMAAGPASL